MLVGITTDYITLTCRGRDPRPIGIGLHLQTSEPDLAAMPLSPYGPLPPPIARYRPFPFELESSAATPQRRSPTLDLMSPITTPGSGGLRRRGRQATACTECNRRKQRVSPTGPMELWVPFAS